MRWKWTMTVSYTHLDVYKRQVLLIGVVVWFATRAMRILPSRFQNAVEYFFETLYNFVESLLEMCIRDRCSGTPIPTGASGCLWRHAAFCLTNAAWEQP